LTWTVSIIGHASAELWCYLLISDNQRSVIKVPNRHSDVMSELVLDNTISMLPRYDCNK